MYLLVVLAAGVLTAYWAAHEIGMDLSGIQTLASVLGFNEGAPTSPEVGYVQPQAAYCKDGQQPAFLNGMAVLDRQVGSAMGDPVECEHGASGGGNTVQQTTTGLATYDSATGTMTFTDGWRHWELTPQGMVTWEGDSSTAPAPTPSG